MTMFEKLLTVIVFLAFAGLMARAIYGMAAEYSEANTLAAQMEAAGISEDWR